MNCIISTEVSVGKSIRSWSVCSFETSLLPYHCLIPLLVSIEISKQGRKQGGTVGSGPPPPVGLVIFISSSSLCLSNRNTIIPIYYTYFFIMIKLTVQFTVHAKFSLNFFIKFYYKFSKTFKIFKNFLKFLQSFLKTQ